MGTGVYHVCVSKQGCADARVSMCVHAAPVGGMCVWVCMYGDRVTSRGRLGGGGAVCPGEWARGAEPGMVMGPEVGMGVSMELEAEMELEMEVGVETQQKMGMLPPGVTRCNPAQLSNNTR